MADHGRCTDCGTAATKPRSRGRCRRCYDRHIKDLKARGEFTPLPNGRRGRTPAVERVLSKVVPGWGGCWIVTGRVRDDGYAEIKDTDFDRMVMAHRVMFETFIGPIPVGLELDHTCRIRRCVFPWHLEPVTGRENLRRAPGSWVARFGERDHCDKGHELTPENTQYGRRMRNGRMDTYRICATCKRAYYKAWRAARREKTKTGG